MKNKLTNFFETILSIFLGSIPFLLGVTLLYGIALNPMAYFWIDNLDERYEKATTDLLDTQLSHLDTLEREYISRKLRPCFKKRYHMDASGYWYPFSTPSETDVKSYIATSGKDCASHFIMTGNTLDDVYKRHKALGRLSPYKEQELAAKFTQQPVF